MGDAPVYERDGGYQQAGVPWDDPRPSPVMKVANIRGAAARASRWG
jgi:hypothetical protein